MNLLTSPATFGLIGASWYAFPELLGCVADHPEKWRSCCARLIICLFTGATAAAVLGPAAQAHGHIDQQAYLNALCTAVGLCANKAVPKAQELLIQIAERWARGKAE